VKNFFKDYRVVAALLVAVFVLSGALTLKAYPPVNYNLGDEIWATQNGINFPGLPHGPGEPVLYFAAIWAFQGIVGEGVFPVRLFSVLMAGVSLYLTFLIGKAVINEKAGLLSAALLATSFAFGWHARIARPEMMTTVFVLSAFYLVVRGVKENPRFLFYGGLLTALSVNVHPNNLQYIAGMTFAYCALAKREVFSKKTLLYLSGILAGLAAWFIMIYLPSKSASMATPLTAAVGDITRVHQFPFMEKGLLGLLKESAVSFPKDYIFEYLRLFDDFFPNTISVWFFAISAGLLWGLGLLTGKRRTALYLLCIPALTAFGNYFITYQFGYWHIIEFYPFLALAMSAAALGLRDSQKKAGALVWAFLFIFCLAGVADTAACRQRMRKYSYERLAHRVSEAVPEGARVIANFYMPAAKVKLLSPWFIEFDRPGRCPDFPEELERLSADYILMDDGLRTFMSKSCGPEYEAWAIRYLNLNFPVAYIDEQYPNYWAEGGLIKGVYVFRLRR